MQRACSAKIEALLRGMGCGFVPEPMAREHIAAGRLVVKTVQRARAPARLATPGAAAPAQGAQAAGSGLALRWWLEQLESATTRRALLERHGAGASARRR